MNIIYFCFPRFHTSWSRDQSDKNLITKIIFKQSLNIVGTVYKGGRSLHEPFKGKEI